MRHLTGWRLTSAAVGTVALAAGAFGLPAVLSNDMPDPAPIEITTVSGSSGPIDDVDAVTPDPVPDTASVMSVPSAADATAASTTSLVSAASSTSPISLNSPDEPSGGATTSSSPSPAPAPALVDSLDSPSSPDSPSSVDSPSSIDS